MVYCDNFITIVVSEIAEVGHDEKEFLFVCYKSGAQTKTRYAQSSDLLQAYSLLQSMLVAHNTGKSMEEHNAPMISLVKDEESSSDEKED